MNVTPELYTELKVSWTSPEGSWLPTSCIFWFSVLPVVNIPSVAQCGSILSCILVYLPSPDGNHSMVWELVNEIWKVSDISRNRNTFSLCIGLLLLGPFNM